MGKVKRIGPRECFVPRAGNVFAQADYGGLELVTLAQTCLTLFGHSALAVAINAGEDPHLSFAAQLAGLTYDFAAARLAVEDKTIKGLRQFSKVANFGYPGGLGAPTFVAFAKASGVDLRPLIELFEIRAVSPESTPEIEVAKALKKKWLARWPEMKDFFAYVAAKCDESEEGEALIALPGTGMLRGGARYTAGCNTLFQGLGAAVTKRAHWEIAKACYVDRASPMFGARVVNVIHDEFILECRDDERAHDVAIELERLMIAAAKPLLPDVTIKAPPLLMRHWSKDAKAIEGPDGRLRPWPATAA